MSNLALDITRAHTKGNGVLAVNTPQKDMIENTVFSIALSRTKRHIERDLMLKERGANPAVDHIKSNFYVWRGSFWQCVPHASLKAIVQALGEGETDAPNLDSLKGTSYVTFRSSENPIKEIHDSLLICLAEDSKESRTVNSSLSIGAPQQAEVKLVEMGCDNYYVIPSIHEFSRNPITKQYLDVIRRNLRKTCKIDALDGIIDTSQGRSLVYKSLIFLLDPTESLPEEVSKYVESLRDAVPTEQQRAEYLTRVLAKLDSAGNLAAKKQSQFLKPIMGNEELLSTFVRDLSRATSGLSYFDIDSVIASIMQDLGAGGIKYSVNTTEDFVSAVLEEKVKIINNCPALEYLRPVSMEDVGGLDCIKDFITSRKVAYTPGAEDFGVKRPKGIFMSGIPGTGKSLAARACGSVLNWPVVRLTLSDLYAGIVGSTEKNTKETLAILERLAPAVVFLDEIDKSINVNSGNGDSGTSQRLLGAILTFMQDSQAPLFWVMAANRVDNLPSELLRKGRLDECFGLDFPTSQERMEVLKIHLRKRGQDIKGIDEEVLETVVADTSGYVPAEIESIVNEAVLTRYRLHLENNESPTLTYADFKAATINMKCIAEVNKEQVQSIQQWVRTSARSASSSTEQLIKPKKAARKATRTDLFEEL